jgi:integrase/recombinase XerD
MSLLPDVPSGFLEPTARPAVPVRGKAPAGTPAALIDLLRTIGAHPRVIEATATWINNQESEASRNAYAQDASWWLAWCAGSSTSPATARAIDADQYAAALRGSGLSKRTRARRLASASSWHTYLVRAELAERNPFAGMKRPSVSGDKSPTRGLDAAQLGALLVYAREHETARTYALFAVLATTAARVGSVLAATVGALGHDKGHRVLDLVVKGNKKHRAVLTPLAVEGVERYLAERGPIEAHELLFPTRTGRPMDEPAVLRTLRRVATAAKVPNAAELSPHSLRHSWATTGFKKGLPLADIQDGMGHADPRTTRLYDGAAGDLDRSPSYSISEEIAAAMRRASA